MTQVYKIQVSMNQTHLVDSGLTFKQGDFGFQIEIEVLDFNVTGVTPQIIFRKATGAVESTNISVSGNKFTYTMQGTELDTPGYGVCDLKLKNSTTQRISTASFRFNVIPDTEDGLNQQANSYSDTIAQLVNTIMHSFVPVPQDWEDGQVLTSTPDGPVWEDPGLPTYEDTKTAVFEWLNAHPSAASGIMASNVFPVGPACKYTTIAAGYAAAVENHGGTVLIYPGVYDEVITVASGSDSYDIKFVGLSREKTIWKSDTFGYDKACFTGSGNLTFENLTMIKGNTSSTREGGGYALHMDYPDLEGDMYVRNCTLISYENAALGCGTRTNQRIFVENCLLISYAKSGQSGYGGLLYHSAPESGHTNQEFSIINNVIMGLGEDGIPACSIWKSGNDTDDVPLTMIGNKLMGTIYETYGSASYTDNTWQQVFSFVKSTENGTFEMSPLTCYGNNHDKMNYYPEVARFQKTKSFDGNAIYMTDTLNPPILNGYIALSSTATADVPGSGTFYGYVISLQAGYHMYFITKTGTSNTYMKVVDNGSVKLAWTNTGILQPASYHRTSNPVMCKSGNVVTLKYNVVKYDSLTLVPESYRPVNGDVWFVGTRLNSSDTVREGCSIQLKTDGTFKAYKFDKTELASNDYLIFSVTYVV